jgi:hypothetical protein
LSVWTRTQNRKAGNGVNDNTYFSCARASWRQHNAPPLHLCVEWVSCPQAKFAANRTWKNDLTFRVSDPERALSLVKLPAVERISATGVVEEFREGLCSTNIHETFILARVKAADLRFN